jgi:hypothetical protein
MRSRNGIVIDLAKEGIVSLTVLYLVNNSYSKVSSQCLGQGVTSCKRGSNITE